MNDDHRDFIKKSASLAAAISIGGVAMACTESTNRQKTGSLFKLREYAKDADNKFSISMSPTSPLISLARELNVNYAARIRGY